MFIHPVDYFLACWFVIAALSTAYVAWDQFQRNPEPTVMKWAFILVTLYLGPLGLVLYVLADKEPKPGEHEEFVKPLWKQGVGSTIHCVAGDATGIILAAVVTANLGQDWRTWGRASVTTSFGAPRRRGSGSSTATSGTTPRTTTSRCRVAAG